MTTGIDEDEDKDNYCCRDDEEEAAADDININKDGRQQGLLLSQGHDYDD